MTTSPLSRALLLTSTLLVASACSTPNTVPTTPEVERTVAPQPKPVEVKMAPKPRGSLRAARLDAMRVAREDTFASMGAGIVASRQAMAEIASRDPYLMLGDASLRGRRDLVITAVGDVSQPTKQWKKETLALKGKVFEPTQHLLDSGDIVFMNLENPISDADPKAKKEFSFTSAPERLGWYIDAGFNTFSLSNNHIADANQEGIDDTLRHLAEYSASKNKTLFWAGAGSTYEEAEAATWIELPDKDLKIAFFSTGFSRGKNVSKFWSKSLVKKIAAAKAEADLVLVSVHAGKEYKHLPQTQLKNLYREWVDAGADVVIGHHPHVIRPVEAYKGAIIIHSLGNYVFASRTRRHKEHGARMYGLVARVIIVDGKPAGIELVPTWVNNAHGWKLETGESMPRADFVPRLVEGPFADVFVEDFTRWTEESGLTPATRVGDTLRVDAVETEESP